MKDVLLFVIGLLTGAILTAFLTPKSGTELRGDLADRYELRMHELNQKMEQLQMQLKKTQAQLKKTEAQEQSPAEEAGSAA